MISPVQRSYYTAVRDAVADREPSSVLVDALAGRSVALVNTDRVGDGIEDARRAVALARDWGTWPGRQWRRESQPRPVLRR